MLFLDDTDDDNHEVCVGWSMFPVFHQPSQSAHIKTTNETAMKPLVTAVRLAVYEGTPRALFSLKHPTQG